MKDFSTKNKSFLEMHHILKEKGVKNNDFMLLLNDDSLQNVNPYSSSLSKKNQKKIREECESNIWYFFREVLRIPINMDDTDNLSSFNLNYGSICRLYSHENHIPISWYTQVRQTGSTITVLCIFLYELIFRNRPGMIVCRNMEDGRVQKFKIRYLMSLLPEWLFYNKDLWNGILVYSTAKKSEIQMNHLARSLTYPLCYIPDAEYVHYLNTIFEFRSLLNSDIPSRIYFQTYFDSVISDDADKNGAISVLKEMEEFNFEMFDEKLNGDRFHVRVDTESLNLSDDDVKQAKSVLSDDDAFRREILLERKDK